MSQTHSTPSTVGREEEDSTEEKSYQIQSLSSYGDLISKVQPRENQEVSLKNRKGIRSADENGGFEKRRRSWFKSKKKGSISDCPGRSVEVESKTGEPKLTHFTVNTNDNAKTFTKSKTEPVEEDNPFVLSRGHSEKLAKTTRGNRTADENGGFEKRRRSWFKSKKKGSISDCPGRSVEVESKTGVPDLTLFTVNTNDNAKTFTKRKTEPVEENNPCVLNRGHSEELAKTTREQRQSHTILSSECLQAHKKYEYVEEDQIDAASRPSVEVLYWKANHFEHFDYVYSLVRDCMIRVAKLLKNNDPAYQMPEDVFVKIGIVGHHTKNNVNLISKRPGKSQLLENQCIWGALPLVCFENESSSKSKLKENTLCQEGVCHKIFIKSDTFCDKADRDEDEDDDSIISVCQDKDQIQDIITSCLEEPLQKMLQQLRKDLKHGRFLENASDIIGEIEAISNELIPINSKDTDVPISGSKRIVPDNVKDFLFRRADVNSFGIWNTSAFKVFVRKTTDFEVLKDELIMLNKNFFQQYDLEIEKMKTEMQTLMREDNVTGALIGFVTETHNHQKMYAWTCNHLFPRENEHFAAVEIKECHSNSCDVAFVKDNKKEINANFYSNSLQTGDSVHKRRATTDVTNGRNVRLEFYLKATDKSNQENTFLLKDIAEKFSERGDSGSLVFSRPNRI